MGVSHTLKDIRPKAEEKARRKAEGLLQETPSGDGFMSERTRAKEALREEVNTYTGENVRKIAATAAAAQEDRILRVAAYCRVSTDDIDQLLSIELQKNNYRDMIKANPKGAGDFLPACLYLKACPRFRYYGCSIMTFIFCSVLSCKPQSPVK